MSALRDQEYFSDGLSEELLNVLAKNRKLQVTSRTSAFSFKGKEVDVKTIAEKLNVTHVLEGSVRKAGNQLRITAQLIEVTTDSHLWSQTYDRQMENIFAVQNDIAAAVAGALKVTLEGAQLPTSQQTNPEAYRATPAATGGAYVRSRPGRPALEALYRQEVRSGMDLEVLKSGRARVPEERFAVFVLAAMDLLGLESLLADRGAGGRAHERASR